jgi:hypothetical protein
MEVKQLWKQKRYITVTAERIQLILIVLATNSRSTFGADISQFYAFGRLTIILPIKISAN